MPPKSAGTLDVARMQGRAAPAAPPPFEDVLPSGLRVKWRMPDPFALIAFDGVIPDPTTAAVIQLLSEEKSRTPDSDPRKLRYDAQGIRGLYGLAAAMLEEPRLDVTREYGSNGTLGRREIGYMDICSLYWTFRVQTRLPARAAPHPDQPPGAQDAAPDSDGVRDDASGADGDR